MTTTDTVTDQLDLFAPPVPMPAANANGGSIYDAFVAFHCANPQVYQTLRRMALAMRRRGVKQFGIAALFEVLRYENALRTSGEEFKLNNNYRSFYARLLMEQESELDGFFETRSLGYITNIPAQGQA